jgi:hypothetical protein
MKPTYTGVGEDCMCNSCGVDVRNINRHDNFHMALNAEIDRLRKRIEELERAANQNLVTV